MQYRIALDPQLELSAAEFAATWNANPPVEDAPAVVDEVSGESFLTPEITVALITAAVSIPTTVIANFVSEYLKKKFIEKKTQKVTVTTITTPDGQPVWIIKQTEE
jgi:hypothetical protein